MSYSSRKQKISIEQEVYIITCCDCGLQFILTAVLVGEEDIQTMDQVKIDYCPYCGKDQRVKHDKTRR